MKDVVTSALEIIENALLVVLDAESKALNTKLKVVVELDEETGDTEQTDATEEIAEINLDSEENVISDSKNVPD